jgi:hypothetical protein
MITTPHPIVMMHLVVEGLLFGPQHCPASYSYTFGDCGPADGTQNMSQVTLQDQETRSCVGCVSHGVALLSCELHEEVW